MATMPAKTSERIKTSLKRFQPILLSAKTRDVNESDTVVIVTDVLEHIFGYDKYTEISSERAIRGTYCDLAIKIDGDLQFLMEVKAIGLELKSQHIKQAVDYAANEGIEWVGLTNGVDWKMYKVSFGKPINFETVIEFNLLNLSIKEQSDIEMLGLLAKESWQKARLEQYFSVKQILNRFTIGALLMTNPIIDVIRRELRRLSPDIKATEEEIISILQKDIIKREVLEGEKAQQAQKQMAKAGRRALRKTREEAEAVANDEAEQGAVEPGVAT